MKKLLSKKIGLKTFSCVLSCAAALTLASCVPLQPAPDYSAQARELMKNSYQSKGAVTLENVLNQDDAQKLCSEYASAADVPKEVAAKIEAAQMALIKYPTDGKFLGDWREGEKIAQNGRGMQFSDAAGSANGGNCYACHQLTKEEISFGNIGPSLHNYGKLRGNSEAILKYTWGKVWNSQAFNACSNMPRYGHNGVLTQAQIRDVMALLLDANSPVNK